jgi:hypothetical protein
MTKLLLKLPWFVSTPVLAAIAVVLALGANYVLGDYFERTFLDEASPLAAAGSPGASATAPAAASTPPPAEPTSSEADAVPIASSTPLPAVEPTTAPASQAGVLATGQFRDGDPGHNGEGTALILRDEDGKLFLRFEDFSVTNGPDLFVILTTDPDGGDYGSGLNLGGNRATDGNVNYEIPGGTDVSRFRSVAIWCRQFDIVFAIATLEEA